MESFSQLLEDTNFLEEHGLLGLFKAEHPRVRQQLIINMQYFKELSRLHNVFLENKLKDIFLIKGASLIQDVYENFKQRPMSDVDFYIPDQETYILLKKVLEDEGYHVLVENKWHANDYKITMIKVIGPFHCTLELHQKLLWKEGAINWKKQGEHGPWSSLSVTDHLVYLIAHMGKQHGFLKFFWLLDIKKVFEKYHQDIEWSVVYQKLCILNCSSCLKLTVFLLKRVFNLDLAREIAPFHFSKWKFFLQKIVFSTNYFVAKKRSTWRVIAAKFLVKDNNWETLEYLFFYKSAK